MEGIGSGWRPWSILERSDWYLREDCDGKTRRVILCKVLRVSRVGVWDRRGIAVVGLSLQPHSCHHTFLRMQHDLAKIKQARSTVGMGARNNGDVATSDALPTDGIPGDEEAAVRWALSFSNNSCEIRDSVEMVVGREEGAKESWKQSGRSAKGRGITAKWCLPMERATEAAVRPMLSRHSLSSPNPGLQRRSTIASASPLL